jgi:type I restriction enzyme S subunit
MSNDWFFEKFALIADAPGAVDRMRELVLELAFRGKLSDNGYHNDNVSGHWTTKTVEEIASSITPGFACSRNHQDEHGHVHLRTHNISTEGNMNFDLLVRVNTNMIDPKKSSLSAGDVLFNNTNSQDLVGKTCLVDKDYNFAFSNHITRIKLYDDAFPAFFVYYLTQLRNKGYFSRICTRWINQAAVNTDALKKLQIPLPPLAEQKRIVAKVDELMGLCDELEAQQQERELRKSVLVRSSLSRFAEAPTPENLGYLFHKSYDIPPSELRKSILTLAVQGKLVPQDPNDEPAENIVWRSETERHGSAAEGDGMQLEGKEFPWKLPLSWKWVRLGVLANIKHGYAFSSESFTSEPTQYVLTTPGNFYESGGFRDRGENTKYFKGQVPPAFIFNAGELIIPMTEQAAGLLGSPAFIPDDGKTYLHNQRIGKLEFYSDEVAPEYVFCFFNHEFFRDELARTCTGMKVRHTSPKRILKVPFALPPLLEQHRIVAKVDQLMALVDELERQQAASREKASNLLDAIVQEMTSGG